MTFSKREIILGVIALALVLFAYGVSIIKASVTADQPTIVSTIRTYELLASTTAETTIATSTAATSTNVTAYFNSAGTLVNGTADVRGAKHVDLYFTRGSAFGAYNSGTTTFAIQASTDPNNTNWVYVDRLIQSTSTPTSAFGSASGVYASDPGGTMAGLGNLVTIGAVGSVSAPTTTRHLYIDPALLDYYNLRCIAFQFATSTVLNGTSECRVVITY